MIKFFLGYSHLDQKKINAIEKAAKKKPFNFEPIIVASSKKPGELLSEKVKSGILETQYFVPIITKNSINNQWVNQEIGFALASDRIILPIIEESIINNLKGFIHNQIDLPFTFNSDKNNERKESYSFRNCYILLFDHISVITRIKFNCTLSPKVLKNTFKINIKYSFQGNLKNGFFDNKIVNLQTGEHFWFYDPDTLDNKKPTTPGNLHGHKNIQNKEIIMSTHGLSKGRYKVFSRIYDHYPVLKNRRYIIAEKIHDFEIK